MIESWVFEFFPEMPRSLPIRTRDFREYFSSYLDLWARDEQFGFRGLFFSEHHYGGSFSPSPNLLIAAIAQRTTTLRLGVMGMVTPLYSPSRIVEEIGMLDQLTGGRLEIGTAVGIPQELARTNMSMAEARERNDEAIQFLDTALTGKPVTFRGKYFECENLILLPQPLQTPAPPKWTTVVSIESARKAAARRSKICTGFSSTARVKEIFGAYRAEADQYDIPVSNDDFALRRRVVIAESSSRAEEMKAGVSARIRDMLSNDPRAVLDSNAAKSNMANAVPDASGGGFVLDEDEFISGTPAAVCEQVMQQCRQVGAANFLAVLHWGAPFDEVSRGHELFSRKVIPRLRTASLNGTA
jgi:alkanesulfonate monooxygenase SsuD/methylene tetrahydromethanopterin reductase-like flavin-dependent oxidoreductase (luciferase family)